MTLLLGWVTRGNAVLIADSAVTHSSPPRRPHSSFGEAQSPGERTVEESALKLARIAEDVGVAIYGNAHSAFEFLDMLSPNHSRAGGFNLLEQLAHCASAAKRSNRFVLMFAHRHQSQPAITVFDPVDGFRTITSMQENAILTTPSLTPRLRAFATNAINSLRAALPEERTAQVAAMTVMQSLGVAEYLPQYKVGGAFFSLACRSAVEWADDVQYVSYPPTAFGVIDNEHTFVRTPSVTSDIGIHAMRVAIRDGVGVVTSSITQETKLLMPFDALPGSILPERIVESLPLGTAYVAPSRFVAFLGIVDRRLVILDRGTTSDRCGIWGTDVSDGREFLLWHPKLVRLLTSPVPEGKFEVFVIRSNLSDGITSNRSVLVSLDPEGTESHLPRS